MFGDLVLELDSTIRILLFWFETLGAWVSISQVSSQGELMSNLDSLLVRRKILPEARSLLFDGMVIFFTCPQVPCFRRVYKCNSKFALELVTLSHCVDMSVGYASSLYVRNSGRFFTKRFIYILGRPIDGLDFI